MVKMSNVDKALVTDKGVSYDTFDIIHQQAK